MVVPDPLAEPIQSILNDLSRKIDNLPVEFRPPLEADLERLRAWALPLAKAKAEPWASPLADPSLNLPQERDELILGNAEGMFARTFHSSPVAQAITRLRDGLILDANASFTRMMGYGREE